MKPSQEQTDKTFELYESAYRKWLKDFVPTEEELAMLFGLSMSVLIALDTERATRLFIAGITSETQPGGF